MTTCVYPGCFVSRTRNFSVTFFSFPNDKRRAVWARHVGKDYSLCTSYTRICEKHFCESEIKVEALKKILKRDAVPKSSVDCGCDENGLSEECKELMKNAPERPDKPRKRPSAAIKKNVLEKLAETGDYIPLNAKSSLRSSTSPKAGPSRKRSRENDIEDDSEELKALPKLVAKSYANNFRNTLKHVPPLAFIGKNKTKPVQVLKSNIEYDAEALKALPRIVVQNSPNNFGNSLKHVPPLTLIGTTPVQVLNKPEQALDKPEQDSGVPNQDSNKPDQASDKPEQASNKPEEESVGDSTNQNEGEKEISMDLIKEETADPLDCSDVVVVSTYQNVTPRRVDPQRPDDSVEIIPVNDNNSSDEECVITVNETADDSVIFVYEEKGSAKPQARTPNFNKGKKLTPVKSPKKKHHKAKLQKQVPTASSSQNPTSSAQIDEGNAETLSKTQKGKKIKIMKETGSSTGEKKPRFVVIDGSNVAFHHSLMKKVFSVEGLKIAIEYFEEKGHEVVAVVPQFRSKKNLSTDPELLKDLNLQGKVIFSPAKNIHGFTLSSYDDLLIMQVAEKNKGVIISNDNFADLLGQNIQWDTIIGTRVVGFTWFKDQFFLPLDPYGRDGPKIDDILYQ